MPTNYKSNTNDVVDLVKLSLTTGYYIAQMARYRYLYLTDKYALEAPTSIQRNDRSYDENKGKMILYTGLSIAYIAGILVSSISELNKRNEQNY